MALDKMQTCRIFPEEYKKIKCIIKKAKDTEGYRKYDSESHFVRCALIKLIREESK